MKKGTALMSDPPSTLHTRHFHSLSLALPLPPPLSLSLSLSRSGGNAKLGKEIVGLHLVSVQGLGAHRL